MSLKRTIAFIFGVLLISSVWRAAEGATSWPCLGLQTTFDFDRYPACATTIKRNCIVGIRFYDAASNRSLATAPTSPGMKGHQNVFAAIPSTPGGGSVYAVTVYLNAQSRLLEGPRDETNEYGLSTKLNR
jgi:hypothetical protein